MNVDHNRARLALLAELDAFGETVEALNDRELLAPSRCFGWSVSDVIVHVHLGLQEMLLGIVTPITDPPDTEAATYWQSPPPSTDPSADDLDGIGFVRRMASAYRRPTGIVGHLTLTLRGIAVAVRTMTPGNAAFQGHVLRSGDFLATWAVELAVHHLDLGSEVQLPPPIRRHSS